MLSLEIRPVALEGCVPASNKPRHRLYSGSLTGELRRWRLRSTNSESAGGVACAVTGER